MISEESMMSTLIGGLLLRSWDFFSLMSPTNGGKKSNLGILKKSTILIITWEQDINSPKL